MADEITVSQLAGSIPDVVRKAELEARIDAAVISKNVSNYSVDVQGKGDRVSLSIMPSISVNDVGSGGSVANQQVSVTAVEVVVDKWKEMTVDIADRSAAQAALDLVKACGKQSGRKLAEKQDTDLAAEHSNMTTYTVGDTTNPSTLSDGLIRLAMLKLDKNSSGANGTGTVPQVGRKFFLSPDANSDVLAQARFSEAQNTGLDRGLQVSGGKVSGLYGNPVFMTNQIATSGSVRKNMYLHEEGLAIATQRKMKIETLARTKLSTPLSGHLLYGVKTVRADHCVILNTAIASDA